MIRGARGATRERIRQVILDHGRRHCTSPSPAQIQAALGHNIAWPTLRRHLKELSDRGQIPVLTKERPMLPPGAEGRFLRKVTQFLLSEESNPDKAAVECGLPPWMGRVIRNQVQSS